MGDRILVTNLLFNIELIERLIKGLHAVLGGITHNLF